MFIKYPLYFRLNLTILILLLNSLSTVVAEGTYEMGEGTTAGPSVTVAGVTLPNNNLWQPLISSDSTYSEISSGLDNRRRVFFVDILNASEVMYIHACGLVLADDIRITLKYCGASAPPASEDDSVYPSCATPIATINKTNGNVACDSDLTAALPFPTELGPLPFKGVYMVELSNTSQTGSFDVISKFNVHVNPIAGLTSIDPTAEYNLGVRNKGRVWSYRWGFRTYDYIEDRATNADYYMIVDGPYTGTYYRWLLDLNKFAGHTYEIMANRIGVDVPYDRYSTYMPDSPSTPTPAASVSPLYPIYLNYPENGDTRFPNPSNLPRIANLRFEDSAGIDNTITPSSTGGIQDTGYFKFSTDADVGSVQIIIDKDLNGFDSTDIIIIKDTLKGENGGATKNPTLEWDGTDNPNGGGTSLANGTYPARVTLRVGEYHFIASDVETSGAAVDGLTIHSTDSTGAKIATQVYWDDTRITTGTSIMPFGQSSTTAAGKHAWGNYTINGFGNLTFIDTYVFGQANEVDIEVVIESFDGRIDGRVWNDINRDGSINSTETGISGTTVVLHAITAGTCTSLQTDAEGFYLFSNLKFQDSQQYQVYEAAGETVPTPANCPPAPTDPIGFSSSTNNTSALITMNSVPEAGYNINNIDFGDYETRNTFSPDHSNSILPGATITYAHRYFASSAADSVTFSTSVNTEAANWSTVLYRDLDCNASIDTAGGDAPLVNPVISGITEGQEICIVAWIQAPTGTSPLTKHVLNITATMSDTHGGNAASGNPKVLIVTDTTTSVDTDRGVISGEKSIAIDANCDDPVAPVAASFGVAKNIKPGECAWFQITFTNRGNSSVSNFAIHDSTPPYTSYRNATATYYVTPASLTAGTITQPAAGATGDISWPYSGTFEPGETVSIVYAIQVDN